MILEFVFTYFAAPFYIKEIICPSVEIVGMDDREMFLCDDDFYNVMYAITVVSFIITLSVICIPVIICPCKLYKNAKIVEKGYTQEFQMIPTQPPIIGRNNPLSS